MWVGNEAAYISHLTLKKYYVLRNVIYRLATVIPKSYENLDYSMPTVIPAIGSPTIPSVVISTNKLAYHCWNFYHVSHRHPASLLTHFGQ
jgi:hypothetical protein